MILQEITGLKGMWIHVPAGGGELEPKARLTSRSKRLLKLILDQLFSFYAVNPTVRNVGAAVKVKVKSAQITQHKEKESSTQYMCMQSGLEFTRPLSLFQIVSLLTERI